MATLASPSETDAPRTRFSQWDSHRIAKSAQRFRGALTYDLKGNLVTRTASLQSPALSLVWDFDNKLRGADTNGTPASLEVTYEYDALGRRVARSGPSGNVVYFQAGQQTIADYPRGGAPASAMYRYVFGSYIDEPLLRETVSGSVRHFFHRNQQYSVAALTDSAGNTADRYAYTAYGGLTVFNSSGTPQATSPLNNRYTYTGREWDDSTKLYRFRALWYDPAAGRFVGRDPLGFVDGMGLYGGYFAPGGGVDPFGLEWEIHRNSGTKAKAVPTDRNDTISELAKLIGLDESESEQWLTIKERNGNGMPFTSVNDPIGWHYCDLPEFEVPNTMVTIWAGEMGILGRFFVSFGKEEQYLKSLGFRVKPVSQGHPNAQLGPVPMNSKIGYSILEKTSSDKELHGVYGWGHGCTPYFGFGSRIAGLGGVAMNDNMKYQYSTIERKTKYHFALTLINACYSQTGCRQLTAQNGRTRGHSGVLDPTNTNAFGPCDIIWLKDLIQPGDQGTKGDQ